MKWFKHMTNFRTDPCTLRIRRQHGRNAKLSWYLLVEVLAEACEGESCSVEMHVADWLVQLDLAHNARKTLFALLSEAQASLRLTYELTAEFLRVTMPEIIKIRDEYSRKRGTNSGHSPERTDENRIDQKKSLTFFSSKTLADKILAAVSKFGQRGYKDAIAFAGNGAEQVIKTCGGWSKLCQSNNSNLPFLRRELEKVADEYFVKNNPNTGKGGDS